jgi:hypothetical protein
MRKIELFLGTTAIWINAESTRPAEFPVQEPTINRQTGCLCRRRCYLRLAR